MYIRVDFRCGVAEKRSRFQIQADKATTGSLIIITIFEVIRWKAPMC